MSYVCGKFACEYLGVKNMVEWLHLHVKTKYLKTECIEMWEHIVWNCMKL